MPRRVLLGALVLAAITVIVYLPSLKGGFLIDDNVLLTDSDLIQAPDGLYRFWFTTQAPDYWPVTSTTLWLEWRLWGMNPTGYRITNLALHIIECLLVWRVLNSLQIPGAYLAALLFAIHPVNVQTVAWISQRKNLMALLFYLPALLWYVRFDQVHRWKWYVLSLLACAAAMLSKGSAATLPVVLLVLIWWRRKAALRDLLHILPFFVICGGLTLVNLWFRTHGHESVAPQPDFLVRLLRAAAIVWFYVGKAIAPIGLVFVYRKWQVDGGVIWWWMPLIAAIAVTLTLWKLRGRTAGRAMLVTWLVFIAALLPVLGFAQVGFMNYSFVADHYQHIAIISLLGLAVAAWNRWRSISPLTATPTAVLATIVLSIGTFLQAQLYGEKEQLYRRTLARNPDVSIVHGELGTIAFELGEYERAMTEFQTAIRLGPVLPEYHYDIGLTYYSQGKYPEAQEQFKLAIAIDPTYAKAYERLGLAIIQNKGSDALAMKQFEQALRLQPDMVNAMNNLAWLYATASDAGLRNGPEAVRLASQAVARQPKDPGLLDTLAAAYAQDGKLSDAIETMQKAISLSHATSQPSATSDMESRLREYQQRLTRQEHMP